MELENEVFLSFYIKYREDPEAVKVSREVAVKAVQQYSSFIKKDTGCNLDRVWTSPNLDFAVDLESIILMTFSEEEETTTELECEEGEDFDDLRRGYHPED